MDLKQREVLALTASSPSSSSSSSSSTAVYFCRICFEEENESSTTMESPCACSGTLELAHRGCIQRWCEEKRSTVCEICLQKFEPDYILPPEKALIEVPVTIRGSLEVPRLHYDPRSDDEYDYPACSAAAERSFSYCRFIALIFTIFLLFKHLVLVLSAEADHYAFTLLTVFALRVIGILLPLYLIMRMITTMRHGQWQQHQQQQLHESNDAFIHGAEEDETERHVIGIHS